MSNIVGVKLRKQFRPIVVDLGELKLSNDDRVMVKTRNGIMIGRIILRHSSTLGLTKTDRAYPEIIRKANGDDIRQEELNIRLEKNYFQACQKKIKKHNLIMKLVDAEIAPDGNKVVFYFVSENRVDFRSLVKELASDLRTRIEMRQIGARSEAQRIGGIGCCGRRLCCEAFLQKFCPVTVKMTKEQGLPLDPEKISGVCGRLMCCLAYEHENYVEMNKGMPKVGKRVKLPEGIGKVKQVNVISKCIYVELEDGVITELKADDYNPSMLVRHK